MLRKVDLDQIRLLAFDTNFQSIFANVQRLNFIEETKKLAAAELKKKEDEKKAIEEKILLDKRVKTRRLKNTQKKARQVNNFVFVFLLIN